MNCLESFQLSWLCFYSLLQAEWGEDESWKCRCYQQTKIKYHRTVKKGSKSRGDYCPLYQTIFDIGYNGVDWFSQCHTSCDQSFVRRYCFPKRYKHNCITLPVGSLPELTSRVSFSSFKQEYFPQYWNSHSCVCDFHALCVHCSYCLWMN